MNKQIEFSIPDFYGYAPLIIHLIQLMIEQPEKFNEDVKIGSCYGSFPCTWNGGRGTDDKRFIKEDVEVATKFLNENGITIRHTFTNCLLEECDLNDTLGNLILNTTKEAQTLKNDVNVGTEVMEKYIKENYPEFNVILSTTMCEKDINVINKKTENEILVLDYTFNNDFERLKQLKNPNNIEILANEKCHDNCPARRKHYEGISKSNLKMQTDENDILGCVYKDNEMNYYKTTTTRKHHITLEDIRNKYLPLGLNKFKIVGRNMTPLYCIEGYCEYLVRPEYKNEIRYELLKSYFGI